MKLKSQEINQHRIVYNMKHYYDTERKLLCNKFGSALDDAVADGKSSRSYVEKAAKAAGLAETRLDKNKKLNDRIDILRDEIEDRDNIIESKDAIIDELRGEIATHEVEKEDLANQVESLVSNYSHDMFILLLICSSNTLFHS